MKKILALTVAVVLILCTLSMTSCGESISIESPTESPTEAPTEKMTKAPTESPTEALTEAPEEFTEALEELTEELTEAPTDARNYVANTNSMKFHYPSCSSAEIIKPENRLDYYGTRESLINKGYEPCKRCNP